jgi:hypothetical protein
MFGSISDIQISEERGSASFEIRRKKCHVRDFKPHPGKTRGEVPVVIGVTSNPQRRKIIERPKK